MVRGIAEVYAELVKQHPERLAKFNRRHGLGEARAAK
jgi:hypothetical protein